MRQLPGQLAYFFAGMAWQLVSFRDPRRLFPILLASALLFVLALQSELLGYLVMPVAVGGIIIPLAYWPSRASKVDDFGDLSYGVYVYHFPVIQGLIALGLFSSNSSGWFGAMWAVAIVTVLSAVSWFWLENPALRLKRKFAS